MMIRAVIFDFGQTLVDSASGFKKAEKQAQEKVFKALGITDRDRFMTHYRRIRKDFHGRSNFSRYAMWEEVFFYYCRVSEADQVKQWEQDYWETVKTHTTPFPEAFDVLSELHTRYDLALITNTQGQISDGTHRIALFPEIERLFVEVIVAGENDVPPKPHPEPFHRCLASLGIAPAEAVYVGDDWRIDVCGSRSAGLHPIWLKHRLVVRNWPEVSDDVPVIDSLDPLRRLDALIGDP